MPMAGTIQAHDCTFQLSAKVIIVHGSTLPFRQVAIIHNKAVCLRVLLLLCFIVFYILQSVIDFSRSWQS